MRRAARIIFSVWFAGAMTFAQACVGPAQTAGERGGGAPPGGASSGAASAPVDTSAMEVDKDASLALTAHLKRNRLPLVGAQVLRNPSTGQRAVVLYGFVATDHGKSDAQRQAEDYVNDPAVDVQNRVIVNPQLLASGGASGANAANNAAAAATANAMPGVQSYVDQQNQAAQIQQYQQQQQQSAGTTANMSSLVPLIALLGMLSAGMAAGGASGYSAGPGYSPYGYPGGYPPYSGYPSPAAPMTPFGYGGSPFGFSGPFSTFP